MNCNEMSLKMKPQMYLQDILTGQMEKITMVEI